MRHLLNYPGCVYFLCFEVLHDIQKFVVDFWLITKCYLHLIQIQQCVFHLGAAYSEFQNADTTDLQLAQYFGKGRHYAVFSSEVDYTGRTTTISQVVSEEPCDEARQVQPAGLQKHQSGPEAG